MTYNKSNFEKFVKLIAGLSIQEGLNLSYGENVGTLKASASQGKQPMIDPPALWVVGQGNKICYVGNNKYEYTAGKLVVMFYPMAVKYEIKGASPDNPFLLAGMIIDLGRMADVLLRIDRLEGGAPKPVTSDPSGIFSIPLSDNLLNPFIRLFETMSDPRAFGFLGESIIDEIYFRLLSDARGGELRYLLQQRGEIQRISKAVKHIHQNLNQPVSVGSLAEMVHMGQTSFYENFKKVMHMSPLKYAKAVKLDRAQRLISDGMKVNEAAYMVGYNSPAHFSREYKHHFGYAPSMTG